MVEKTESITAKLCAFARAYHSNVSKSKVFDDYLAYDLMGKDEYESVQNLITRGFPNILGADKQVGVLLHKYLAPIPLSRTRFAEDALTQFVSKHDKVQYVISGAGYDTFAFRNTNPNIEIFEIDHPDTQKYKIEKINKLQWNIPKNVHFVSVDFEKDDLTKALVESGFDTNKKTFFSILGVSYYLTLPVFSNTIRNLAALSSAGSKIVFDYPDKSTLDTHLAAQRVSALAKITEHLGENMQNGFTYLEIQNALRDSGFEIQKYLPPQKIQKSYFNDNKEQFSAFENVHFISAVYKERGDNMKEYIFTSESVTEGHPDKVCDNISDALLDAYLKADPFSRVAVESTVKNNTVIVLGEVSSNAKVDIEKIVRNTIREIGYNSNELGFNSDDAEIIIRVDRQSPDIAQGVDNAIETRQISVTSAQTGAGDQGMVFGYATNETSEFMPLPISLAHKLARQLTKVRKEKLIPYLRPDGKTQVSVKYADNKAVCIDTIVVSTQHNPEISEEQLSQDIMKYVIDPVISKNLINQDTKYLINPTGRFVVGGPAGDSGLTGRKIIVDTYGGYSRHGGGAFSGKDPTKVDRSAAYAARYAAKNIVAAGLAKECEIQIAYAIGVANPVSILVDTFGTGEYSDESIADAVHELFDFRPDSIINQLNLRQTKYQPLAAYGHVGREDLKVSWENTDSKDKLKQYFNRSN